MYDVKTSTLSFRLSKRLFVVLMTAVVPLAMMAQWSSLGTRNEPPQKKTSSGEPIVSVGFYHTGDFYKTAAGVGAGLMLTVGRTGDLLNGSIGAEFIEYISGDPRPEDEKSKLSVVGSAGQVVVPAFLKLQLFRTSKWTKFYVGCGCEMGFKVNDNKKIKGYYQDDEILHKNTFAIVPIIGWRSGSVDFGLYYKHYTKTPFNPSLDGSKDLSKDKARIGYHLTCYF